MGGFTEEFSDVERGLVRGCTLSSECSLPSDRVPPLSYPKRQREYGIEISKPLRWLTRQIFG